MEPAEEPLPEPTAAERARADFHRQLLYGLIALLVLAPLAAAVWLVLS